MASSGDAAEKKGKYLIQNILENYVAVSLVTLTLKPAGNAPTLKTSKFAVPGDRTVSWLQQWLKKALHSGPEESMVKWYFCPNTSNIILKSSLYFQVSCVLC